MQNDAGFLRDFERVSLHHERLIRIEEITSQSPCFVLSDFIRHLIRGIALHSAPRHPRFGPGGIAGNFVLIKERSTAVSVPQTLDLLVMFNEEPISGHIITVHHESVRAHVGVPADTRTVVSPPEPRVVNHHIRVVDLYAPRRASFPLIANAREDIVKKGWVSLVIFGGSARTHLQKSLRVHRSGVEQNPGNLYSAHV